jgi:hypothetical protein
MARIDDLVRAAQLKEAHRRALSRKLDSAIKQMLKGNLQAAADKIVAVMTQVEVLEADGHLSPPDAAHVLSLLRAILESLAPSG